MKRSGIHEVARVIHQLNHAPSKESELTINLRRRRAPMDLLRPASAGKEKRGGKLERKIRSLRISGGAAANMENARLLRRGESEGLRFAESPAKSGLGRRKSAQGRPFRATRHAQARPRGDPRKIARRVRTPRGSTRRRRYLNLSDTIDVPRRIAWYDPKNYSKHRQGIEEAYALKYMRINFIRIEINRRFISKAEITFNSPRFVRSATSQMQVINWNVFHAI